MTSHRMWSLNSVRFLEFYTSQFLADAWRSMTEGRGLARIVAVLNIGSTAARWTVVDRPIGVWKPRGILSFWHALGRLTRAERGLWE